MTLWFVLALMTAAAAFAVLWPLGRRARAARGQRCRGLSRPARRDRSRSCRRPDRRAGGRGGADRGVAAAARVQRMRSRSRPRPATRCAGGRGARRAACCFRPVRLPSMPAKARRICPTSRLRSGSIRRPSNRCRRWSPASRRIWSAIPRTAAAGRCWRRSTCGSAATRRRRRRDAMSCACSVRPPAREADLGEALTGAANGVVTAEAKAAFERALALDASEFKARYFIGLAAEQDGRPAEAAAMWRALLRQRAAGRDLARLRSGIADAGRSQRAETGCAGAFVRRCRSRGKTVARAAHGDGAAAWSTQLAERLKSDGRDVEGWVRLMRAYMVLGERDKAASAVAEARRALADDADRLRHARRAGQRPEDRRLTGFARR